MSREYDAKCECGHYLTSHTYKDDCEKCDCEMFVDEER